MRRAWVRRRLVELAGTVLIIWMYIESGSFKFLHKKEYRGVIIDLYYNPPNRNSPTIKVMYLENGKEKFDYYAGLDNCHRLYHHAQVGDSLIKLLGSTEVVLKRGEDSLNTYFLDESCYGYREVPRSYAE